MTAEVIIELIHGKSKGEIWNCKSDEGPHCETAGSDRYATEMHDLVIS